MQDFSFVETIKYSNMFDSSDYSVLRTVGYLGATLRSDVSPQDACLIHLTVMPQVYEILRQPPLRVYQRIVVPFIVGYWREVFHKMRFRFSSPQIIEKGLKEIQDIPEDQQAQTVLKMISYSLNVQIPQEARSWAFLEY
jgi:hypothetical protein